MFCIHCGREIVMDGFRYCPFCGADIGARPGPGDAERPVRNRAHDERRTADRMMPFKIAIAVLVAVAAILIVTIALLPLGPAVTLVAEDGVSGVSGDGTYRSGDLAYVSASVEEGYAFLGWYSDGEAVSGDSAFWFEVTEPVELHALAELERMAWTESGTLRMESPVPSATGTSWKVTDSAGAVVFSGDGASESCTLSDGVYSVTVSATVFGTAYERTDSVGVGVMSKTFKWYYAWNMYSITLPMSYEVYEEYRYKNADDRAPRTDSAIAAFVTSDAPEIRDLADRLTELSSGMTDMQRANLVLKFVQSTGYVSDTESRGVTEWFKYPFETLYDNAGDCEDTSFLYCALMEAMGYDTVLLKYTTAQGYAPDEGHMACAVAVDGYGTYYTYNGTKYYFCETTSSSGVGVGNDDYDRAYILHID